MKSDLVMVLDEGKIVEMDEPKKLIATESSHFRKMYEDANRNMEKL